MNPRTSGTIPVEISSFSTFVTHPIHDIDWLQAAPTRVATNLGIGAKCNSKGRLIALMIHKVQPFCFLHHRIQTSLKFEICLFEEYVFVSS